MTVDGFNQWEAGNRFLAARNLLEAELTVMKVDKDIVVGEDVSGFISYVFYDGD